MSQKSYDEIPSLYLIPTPIGNMDDITYRAVKTLEMVDVLLTEDTRVTVVLLKHLDIKKKMVVNNEQNELKNINMVIEYLEAGKNVGLVSDRGTPVISDPGYNIAYEIINRGYKVIGLPGATALIPALIMSGLKPMPFLFVGFLNSKESKREKELVELSKNKYTMIFYEAPHRIEKTLNSILKIMGNRKISISREISKKFEEVYRGTVEEVIPLVIGAKGEFVIVLNGDESIENYEDVSVEEQVEMLLDSNYSLMDAIKEVAKRRNVPKNEIYNNYHKKVTK